MPIVTITNLTMLVAIDNKLDYTTKLLKPLNYKVSIRKKGSRKKTSKKKASIKKTSNNNRNKESSKKSIIREIFIIFLDSKEMLVL